MSTAHVQRDARRRILAIDPGPEKSAWLVLDGRGWPTGFGIDTNDTLLGWLRAPAVSDPFRDTPADVRVAGGPIVIEEVRSFGMAVGREVFDTVRFTGRIQEAVWPHPVEWLGRITVKTHVCHSAKAKDANVRAALIDLYGASSIRKGGPLYKIANDVWSALALAVTYADGAA